LIRFCSLGSGSTGNATLVEAHDGMRTTRVLVDCGFTVRQLSLRLARHGLSPADLDAVFVTHEHSDHIGCATALARRFKLPLWMGEGTWRVATRGAARIAGLNIARDGEPIAIGAMQLMPFKVPHDAAEPLQLTFSDGQRRLGILTDLGQGNEHVVAHLRRCDALLLECNHDSTLLETGPYPFFLKRRIGGPMGHLANAQAAEILRQCRHAGLRHVVAAHLSQHNNRPELAAATIAGVLGTSASDVVVAHAVDGSPWLDLH
jgi:phosphoribosyl 1,2-cyclic phosphodiesterase